MAFFNKIDPSELGLQLFNSVGLSDISDSNYEKEINKIYKRLKHQQELGGDMYEYIHRQNVLKEIMNLIPEPKNAKERFTLAMTYAWSRVEYRKKAIEFIEFYLNNPLYEDSYKNSHHSANEKGFTLEEEKNIHLSNMYAYLGKAYVGEYNFNKALISYKKANELAPFWAHTYIHVSDIYIKLNNLTSALNILKDGKKFKSKHTDKMYKKVLNNNIEKVQIKIEKGYVYKPRKK